jgi:hypothetical protein
MLDQRNEMSNGNWRRRRPARSRPVDSFFDRSDIGPAAKSGKNDAETRSQE